MSGLIYPSTLPGLTWDSVRTAMFKTGIKTALSGKESRLSYQQYPLFRFDLQYELLRDYTTPSDLRSLAGLFQAMKGSFDTFLYSDPTYNSVTAESFGTGNGVTTAFQLIATFQNAGGPGGAEIIQNLNGTPTIQRNGVTLATPADYSIGPTGIVTFTAAPGAGLPLTWTGSFYYRCRFVDDEMSLTQFMNRFWKSRTVALRSVKL